MAAKAMAKWWYEAMVTAAGTEKIFYPIYHKFKPSSSKENSIEALLATLDRIIISTHEFTHTTIK